MKTLYSTILYLLVDQPTISQFEWKTGLTLTSSLLFPLVSIFFYLSLTLLSLRFSSLLPVLSTTTLHRITAIHSLILCLLSLIMVIGCSLSVVHQMPRHDHWQWFVCFPANRTLPRGPIFFWAKFFYLSKILEFIDTLLIIFSHSRSRRLSFLHIYHHAMVPIICYLTLSSKNSQSMIHVGVITNSSVHVIMYAYYFLCALGKRPRWKKLVTNCQIFQFVVNFLCAVATMYFHLRTELGCSGIGTLCFNIIFNTSLLLLFLDFHSKNYAKNIIKDHDHNKLIDKRK